MTLQQFYVQVDGNYDDVIERLRRKDRIINYLFKIEASEDFRMLCEKFKDKNYTDAFRYIHNLKGISLNLGIRTLEQSSTRLCDAMKNGSASVQLDTLFLDVKKDYKDTIEAIKEIQEKNDNIEK